MIDVYMERFEHPYLFALIPAAGVFFAAAVGATAIGSDFVAGFLSLYASVMLVLCALGYGTIALFSFSTKYLRQWRINRSGFE
ncbi:hypothetical protein G6M89_12435 [Natronolimnobius sp. AArcel1]|uniref:hypothetical protein n=1 Tax=Natronolimnobius sp. AArcel1 TaxID=1679093 RepID=UPI0013EE2B77|nr:hypothetical protein [Natronolimnobius sp. AArcel1]NGM69805.1 hypothetical protein [Natronolimnobius sp. AArcel1]